MKKLLSSVLTLLLLSTSAQAEVLWPEDLLSKLEHHPKVTASEANLDAARAQIEQARSEHLPHLFAQVATNRQGEETKAPTYIYTFKNELQPLPDLLKPIFDWPEYANLGYTVTAFTEAYEAKLGFTWLLYSGGATQNQVASKKMALRGLEAGHQRLKQGLAHGALTAYLGLEKAQALGQVAREYQDLTAAHVAQVKEFLKRGVIAPVDLARAQKAKSDADIAVAQAQDGLNQALNGLAYLTGQSQAPTLPRLELLAFDAKSLTEERPEKEALAYGLQAAQWGQKAAQAVTDAPKLFAQGDLVAQGRSWPPKERQDWTLALALRWDFADGGKSQALADEAKAKGAELQAQIDDLARSIAREIADAKSALALAETKVKSSAQALALAQESARVAQLKYQNGLGSELDVQDALLLEHQAKGDQVSAKIDLLQAHVNLAYALGDPMKAYHPVDYVTKKEEDYAKSHR